MARTRCDWCKKRRVCELIVVQMHAPANRREGLRLWLWAHGYWRATLCSQCRKSYAARLHTAFRDVPE